MKGDNWKHLRRGSNYTEVGPARLQAEQPIGDDTVVMVYQDKDGALWVRPMAEFHDGRFERVDPPLREVPSDG